MTMPNFSYPMLDRHLHDKDTFTNDFMRRILNMTDSMFVYTGLPETVPSSQLEKQLKVNGSVGFVKVNNELYALSGNAVDELGVYGEPLQYQITNTYLNLSETFEVGKNVALVYNDTMVQGIVPVVAKYVTAICDTEISLDTLAVLSRISMLISAPDDKSKAAADLFLKKVIEEGKFTVIGDNAFFNGVKLSAPSTQSMTRINDVVSLLQYYRATMFNELGLQANWNTKRENLNMDEVGMNVDVLLPLADNMLKERQEGIERVNELWGTAIHVEFGSAWLTTQEESETETSMAQVLQSPPIEVSTEMHPEGAEGDSEAGSDEDEEEDTDNDPDAR